MAAPPTNELGLLNDTFGWTGGPTAPWASFVDAHERVPELTWPFSILTYEAMISDSQVGGLMRGCTMPIRRYEWRINPNGARPEIVDAVAADLNLPITGKVQEANRGRLSGRFNHDAHLMQALRALTYGHMYFEQVGTIGEDGRWHLRKLAPRLPRTINEINVASDGGLVSIKQNVARIGVMPPEIPVDRLVGFIWDQEPGNWVGRSMLHDLYKNWVIKDRLLRVDAMMHERAGTGIPVAEAQAGASPKEMAQLQAAVTSIKAGMHTGVTVPAGANITLQGIQGVLPNTLASIKYHDEIMARSVLMMFMQLGQTRTGSRALGSAFIDFFSESQQTLAKWYCETMNEHVIEDWVNWNYSEGEEYCPLIEFQVPADPRLSTAELVELITSRAITVDVELEKFIRDEHGLPKMMDTTEQAALKPPEAPPADPLHPAASIQPGSLVPPVGAPPKPKTPVPAVKAASEDAGLDAVSPLLLPARPLRRQPYSHEIMAQVNFANLDGQWAAETEQLVGSWLWVRSRQIDELHDAIVAAKGDLVKLSALMPTAHGADTIHERMVSAMTQAAHDAVKEAAAQGVTIDLPDLTKAAERLLRRADAVEQLLTRSLGSTAARKAVQLTGAGKRPAAVAKAVQDHLLGLSSAYLQTQLGGALSTAQNMGRVEVMDTGPPADYYASELLDEHTCVNCDNIDGTHYGSLDEAESDYPTGGYQDCLGQERCRGTVVAVYAGGGSNAS